MSNVWTEAFSPIGIDGWLPFDRKWIIVKMLLNPQNPGSQVSQWGDGALGGQIYFSLRQQC